MHSERNQIVLIISGIAITLMLGAFFYRELHPEYKIYQDDYIALEKFRSSYSGEPPPEFSLGIKQIVFEREDKGPASIDRCISCHVAEQLPHFSPTKIAYDVNGNIVRDADGKPVQVPNENYVWARLEEKIKELKDPKVLEQLKMEGKSGDASDRLNEAAQLESLKIARVGDHVYDVTKVLKMHPLMGNETRPFEFHPLEEYGCTVCHSGNGRGLTTDKAHGPVFDGDYEEEYMGPHPEFLEKDEKNDPAFARAYNSKPGHDLIFQTKPILIGNLIQSSCMQCHNQSSTEMRILEETATDIASRKENKVNAILEGYEDEKQALTSLLKIDDLLSSKSLDQTIEEIQNQLKNGFLLPKERDQIQHQLNFLLKNKQLGTESVKKQVNESIIAMLGSSRLYEALKANKNSLDQFIQEQSTQQDATGSLFIKYRTINFEKELLKHVENTQKSFGKTASDPAVISAMATDVDWLTKNFNRGQQLYLSQACYACHKIAGFARGGVGPELTRAGDNYYWYLKESIVWPQADLKTSTMPNFVLDHVELEDLMTYLLAQKGSSKAVSQVDYKVAVQEWEAGRKMPWEKPVPPSDLHNLRYAMTVFATEGCAACHRLEGFESNVGFTIEKEKSTNFDALYKEKQWFQRLFPEEVLGSAIVNAIEKNAAEIDKRIATDVRAGSILEEIEATHPEMVESLYSNFRFASRAKDDYFNELKQQHPESKAAIEAQQAQWKQRVHNVLMMYVQNYGLGRLIGPRPNWSGVYRSDEWLMEHFRNPSSHVPKSIMPVFPFDETKFYALTYMLDELGKRNRDAVHQIWRNEGFNPEQAYEIYCSQCHGTFLQGNGPVATWIYPIPKNLRNAEFLRNLTRENVIQSIAHGVKGTPMPPWSETPRDKYGYDGIPVLGPAEVEALTDWLFTGISGGTIIRGSEDVPKWQYTPNNVIEDLKREGNQLKAKEENKLSWLDLLPQGDQYYAALEPKVVVSPESNQIFDVIPNPIPGGEKYSYYIKKKYYTEENIEQGKQFFEHNCAVCHGSEADGTGARASIMQDAKPRMLTNFNWINTRDDLRLLRSIKYGVSGTSMTPWGDLTSTLQRLQLVMFIRSLTEEKEKREVLTQNIYHSFDQSMIAIDRARSEEYKKVDQTQKSLEEVIRKQQAIQAEAAKDPSNVQKALELYKSRLELAAKLDKEQQRDQQLQTLKSLVAKESDVYRSIGNDLLSSGIDGIIWNEFLQMVQLNESRFSYDQNALQFKRNPEIEKQVLEIAKKISGQIDEMASSLEKNKVIAEGKLASPERTAELQSISTQMTKLENMKIKVLSGIEETKGYLEQQEKIYSRMQLEK